jgi:pyrimidine-specific ribonucleoside hydrolase
MRGFSYVVQGFPRPAPYDGAVRVAFDMETRDPDDVLTLCLLAGHRGVRLEAVTVNPGRPAQIGVVREVLARLGADVPVGARVAGSERDEVSPFHRDWLGDVPGRAGRI